MHSVLTLLMLLVNQGLNQGTGEKAHTNGIRCGLSLELPRGGSCLNEDCFIFTVTSQSIFMVELLVKLLFFG